MTHPAPILPHLSCWTSRLAGAQQPVNTYYWTTPTGCIVIDPAADAPARSDVTDIFITHLQEEHAAGGRQFPRARVHVAAGDEYLCGGWAAYERVLTKWEPPWDWETRGNYRGHLGGARNERPPRDPLSVTSAGLPAGARLVETPGHGKHARTLLATMDGRRVAFCGDLIYGNGRLWNWFDADWDYGLQGGQHALLDSAQRLAREPLDLLCPAHGPVIENPAAALTRLIENLRAVLNGPSAACDTAPLLVATPADPATGFRPLLPHLYQYLPDWGNCALLRSDSGAGLLVDDGLCFWKPLPERAAHHRAVIAALKRSLGLDRIEMVIPTHYHGDHLENIPELVALEGAEVVCLDIVADVIEQPDRFNLACELPWYGTNADTIKVDRRVPSGTRLRWREYELEIFHLGGQTYYHAGIATVVDGQRVIFVGDSVNASPGVEPVLTYNDNEPATRGWLYAVERLIERRPDLLVCGHAAAVRSPGEILELKRRLWREQVERYRRLSARDNLRLFFDPFV